MGRSGGKRSLYDRVMRSVVDSSSEVMLVGFISILTLERIIEAAFQSWNACRVVTIQTLTALGRVHDMHCEVFGPSW
jgi:hypothetical protein